MAEIDAIIPAAGMSRRMGETNKLLLDVGGVPMIRNVVEQYICAVDGQVRVVTGFENARVEEALKGLPLVILHNHDYADGQQGSVTIGLQSASGDQATLVGLGDQPRLTSADLNWLVRQYLRGDRSRISIPVREGQRGNPILVPANLRSAILADRQNPGCRRYTRENPDQIQFLNTESEGFFVDVDTPEDFANLSAGLRRTA